MISRYILYWGISLQDRGVLWGGGVVINIESRKMACEGNRITRREQVVLLRETFHFSHLQIA